MFGLFGQHNGTWAKATNGDADQTKNGATPGFPWHCRDRKIIPKRLAPQNKLTAENAHAKLKHDQENKRKNTKPEKAVFPYV